MSTEDYYAPGEKGVMKFIRQLLEHGKFTMGTDLPDVQHFEEELRLPRGRVDFIVFHVDGSISIIEAKGDGDLVTIGAGIGQLLLYTIQVGMSWGVKGTVRGLLVAPVEVCTAKSRLLHGMCERAGMIRTEEENVAQN